MTAGSSIWLLAVPIRCFQKEISNEKILSHLWKITGHTLRKCEVILKQVADGRLIECFLSFLKGLSLRIATGGSPVLPDFVEN